ncbi:c6 zinc finger domain containing protein [Grosmannia clavigera kw1407]|uniref:C6 zinc finger domain containing protein n=1 Tax=Grosmannia clavigera (strain kw1407 / UAMH 11150) TaxID=655863 RepID=F0XM02_GROCL|nr:c6 zinc finger domain containing protein [Grosmannia clavigera kw1407]EFX01276.1 c6 zinc finger domain containing protein [Grosmannia clavigera kw1407]
MAGPGGGPPRRSHTKSRKGCETCKRRHIRCDETFPQCRNCTKHKIRCPYNDIAIPDDRSVSPDRPDLMWTPEIEAQISHWQQTGVFPFPELNVYPEPNPRCFSVDNLRLIYHVASICHQLRSIDADGFTIWTRQIPTIIKIGATNNYVMHALLAFSASHMTYLNECPVVGIMADEHRGIALKGLQEAISTFSRETSDAILAASLVLSWQATDWRSWTQLMQGTRSVIEAMGPWKHESQFGDFIAESSTFPTAPPSPVPDHKPNQPRKEDLEFFVRTTQQLQNVEAYLKHNKEDTRAISQLITFIKGARKESNTPVAQQFARLRPLRDWLFWTPVRYFQSAGSSPGALITIAHLYTVALVMERLFPEIGAAYFGSLSIGPVEEIARRLLSINVNGAVEGDVQTPLSLMEFPIDVVHEFRSRMGWVHPARTPSFPQFNPPNFSHHVSSVSGSLSMPPTTGPSDYHHMAYGAGGIMTHPNFSYSTEDLSLLSAEPSQSSAISPLQLSSPYVAQQYLNIPSPSYGGYSPASSTLGDFGDGSSVAYSDNDDFGPYDVTYASGGSVNSMGHAQMLGGSNNFGVGFVSPLQTVWI